MRRFIVRQFIDLAAGVAVTLAIFLCVEVVLRVGGYGEGRDIAPRHLAAGFDEAAQVFVPTPEVPGGWRTRYIHETSPDLVIPPKGNAKRLLMLGGSNTAGFSRVVLGEALNAQGRGAFEVLNLGRPGYGSTRVSIILRAALECLEPDVVVIYSGHNEFVEKSFAMDVSDAWGNPVVAALASRLESTVTGRLLTGLAEEDAPAKGQYANLADWDAEYQKFKDVPWERTLTVWDAYEANLRYMCSLAESKGIPVLLCTPVWNRLSVPRIGSSSKDVDPAGLRRVRSLLRRAAEQYPAPFQVLLPRIDRERVHKFDWHPNGAKLPDENHQAPLPGLRPSIGWLEERDSGFPIDRHWGPRVREWYEALEWLHGGVTESDRAALEAAQDHLEGAAKLLPDDAPVVYESALVRYALGERGEEVRGAFERAARLDHAPRKAGPASNDRVRQVARDFAGVHLYDSDALFAGACPDGLVAWEWMLDHCHLSSGASDAMLEDWARVLIEILEGSE